MAYQINIPRAMKEFDKGKFTVSNTSVALPASALAIPKGRDMEILLHIGTNDIHISPDGVDATTDDMPYSASDKLSVPGFVACSNLRFIRDSADATVYYWSYYLPL